MKLRMLEIPKGIAIVAAGALVVGVAVVGLSAQQPARGGARNGQSGMGPGAFGLRMHAAMRGMFLKGVKALELTAEQKTQIRTAMQGHREEFKAIARDMAGARGALNDAVTADAIDEAAIKAASARVAEVEVRAALLRANVHREMFGVLTPEQQQKAKAMRDGAKARIRKAVDQFLEP
jgi:Spy/CpxP family protein refolding chaperone